MTSFYYRTFFNIKLEKVIIIKYKLKIYYLL